MFSSIRVAGRYGEGGGGGREASRTVSPPPSAGFRRQKMRSLSHYKAVLLDEVGNSETSVTMFWPTRRHITGTALPSGRTETAICNFCMEFCHSIPFRSAWAHPAAVCISLSSQLFSLQHYSCGNDLNCLQLHTLTLRWLMSYIYGAPILDVSRSHTTTQHSR